jgi:hypothetical protein
MLTLRSTHSNCVYTLLQQQHHTVMSPPLLHNHSNVYFLGCAHKHPYPHMVQRDVVRLNRAMYPYQGIQ